MPPKKLKISEKKMPKCFQCKKRDGFIVGNISDGDKYIGRRSFCGECYNKMEAEFKMKQIREAFGNVNLEKK